MVDIRLGSKCASEYISKVFSQRCQGKVNDFLMFFKRLTFATNTSQRHI